MTTDVRAAVIVEPGGPVEVRTYRAPRLVRGNVLLRTIASEVCGTDVHLLHGRLSGVPYPLIPGHVAVGRVEETRGPVVDVEGRPVGIGDVVTYLDVHATCGACWYCLVAHAPNRCPSRRVYGITYGAEDGLHGGWAEYIHLRPGVRVVPMAPGVDADLWIAGGCGLPTALHAVDLAKVRLGDTVTVLGAGPVGLCAAALAAASGAGCVISVDPAPLRREAALRMGADHAVSPGAEARDAVGSATNGRGADAVIEATGVPTAFVEGCELARDAGTVVVVGHYTDAGAVPLNPHTHLNRKHLTVRGCWGTDFAHVWRAMRILSRLRRRFPWSSLVSRRYSLEEAGQAIADVEAKRVVKAVIVP